jgi:hypothetical protein
MMLRGGGVMSLLLAADDAQTKIDPDDHDIVFATAEEMTAKADDIWKRLEAMQACQGSAIEQLKSEIEAIPDGFVLTRAVALACLACLRDQCRVQMDVDGLRVMLALELMQARSASWPKTLDDLRADDPTLQLTDCITGQPFIYRRADDGRSYVLYSVGADLTNDGGRMNPDGNARSLTKTSGAGFDYVLNTPRSLHMMAEEPNKDQ